MTNTLKDFKEFINTKSHCLSQKKPGNIQYESLCKTTSSAQMNLIATDFLKVDRYSRGYEHILVMVELFARYVQGCYTKQICQNFSGGIF